MHIGAFFVFPFIMNFMFTILALGKGFVKLNVFEGETSNEQQDMGVIYDVPL